MIYFDSMVLPWLRDWALRPSPGHRRIEEKEKRNDN